MRAEHRQCQLAYSTKVYSHLTGNRRGLQDSVRALPGHNGLAVYFASVCQPGVLDLRAPVSSLANGEIPERNPTSAKQSGSCLLHLGSPEPEDEQAFGTILYNR